VLEQEVAASTIKEQDAIAKLAQSECLHFCSLVITQLPKEIRDMIYQYLTTTSERISRDYFRSTMDPKTRMHTYNAARWKSTHYPEHYWNFEYVSLPFLHELTQTYFRTSAFIFSDDDDTLIERFLTTDQMQNGFAPQELVSKIEIHLNAVTYDRTTCIGYMFGCATKPERLRAALKGVEELKSGANVCVRFKTRVKDEEQKREQVRTACEALVPCLREARGKGYCVRLVIDEDMEIELDDGEGGYEMRHARDVRVIDSDSEKMESTRS
jgi:hypothetical protein